MIRWQKAGKKTGVSVLLALALVIGSSVTAFASSAQVVEQQNDMYCKTRVQEADISDADDLEEYVIPADQVDEEKWDNAIVYDDALLEPLSVQKNFDWKVPGNNFARSGAFIKKAGPLLLFPAMYMMTDIIMSVSADRMVRCFMLTECIRLQRHLTARPQVLIMCM